jgi:hypothetical protein
MLREMQNVQRVSGEAKRRWFFCHDLDLVSSEVLADVVTFVEDRLREFDGPLPLKPDAIS